MSLEERSERGARLLEQMLGPEGAQQVRGASCRTSSGT
jgi:hypothetical protein